MRNMNKLIALILCVSVFFTGCGGGVQSQNLMKDIKPNPNPETCDGFISPETFADFSAGLFAAVTENDRLTGDNPNTAKNTLISPASLLYVLAMIGNGAEGETLAQLETVLGMNVECLNTMLYSFMKNSHKSISAANGIWVKEGFKANRDYLQTNADFLQTAMYSRPFDNSTVKDINNFVNKNTDGMIDKIVDRLDPQAVMCLVNALTFQDKWAKEYEKNQINDGIFTAADGSRQDAEFMHSRENIYLQSNGITGFVKPYKSGEYNFVALLPPEGTDINQFTASLDGEVLNNLLNNAIQHPVDAVIPQFEARYSRSMIESLKAMGLTDIFDRAKSDLSGMGESDNGLYIDTLLHKTYISVDPQGTKAAAVTLGVANESRAADPIMVYYVRLDRPFVYMIVQKDSGLPIFIGSVAGLEDREYTVSSPQ